MSVRAVPGWQTVLADLALILFVSSAAALAQGDGATEPELSPLPLSTQTNTPSAIYLMRSNVPPFTDWLTAQPRDPRERLTIVAIYAAGEREAVWTETLSLSRQSQSAGFAAAIVMRPGETSRIGAQFAFDGAED